MTASEQRSREVFCELIYGKPRDRPLKDLTPSQLLVPVEDAKFLDDFVHQIDGFVRLGVGCLTSVPLQVEVQWRRRERLQARKRMIYACINCAVCRLVCRLCGRHFQNISDSRFMICIVMDIGHVKR